MQCLVGLVGALEISLNCVAVHSSVLYLVEKSCSLFYLDALAVQILCSRLLVVGTQCDVVSHVSLSVCWSSFCVSSRCAAHNPVGMKVVGPTGSRRMASVLMHNCNRYCKLAIAAGEGTAMCGVTTGQSSCTASWLEPELGWRTPPWSEAACPGLG